MQSKRIGGLIRISDSVLGIKADSPAKQKDSIRYRAKDSFGFSVADEDFLELWDSASGDIQPAEQAVQFCIDRKLDILFINNIKRFTRRHIWYFPLKRKLEEIGVQLLDTEGVISPEKVNTLKEYGVGYNFSIYNKSEEQEARKAIEAEVDWRERLTQLIGAECRYASLGYWMYGATPYGYKLERVDTEHGLRWLLVPRLEESQYIVQIFELVAEGKLTKNEIVDYINGLGYTSRIRKKRHPAKNKKDVVIGTIGGKKLTVKQLDDYLVNPIYAGVLWEERQIGKDKNGKNIYRKQKPKQLAGTALVSWDLYNKANKGKWSIEKDENDTIYISRSKVPYHMLFKNIHNDSFPYKQFIVCPTCKKPLYAGNSRNGSGVPDPRYHCNRSGHYWSVKADTLHNTVKDFIKNVRLKDDVILRLKKKFLLRLETHRDIALDNSILIDKKIAIIKADQQALVEQAKKMTHPMIIKSIEDDISKKELELGVLINQRNKQETKKAKLQEAINYYWHFFEHPEEVMIQPDKPSQSARFFSLLFEELPTHEELVLRTARLACVFDLNDTSNNRGEPSLPITYPFCLCRLFISAILYNILFLLLDEPDK